MKFPTEIRASLTVHLTKYASSQTRFDLNTRGRSRGKVVGNFRECSFLSSAIFGDLQGLSLEIRKMDVLNRVKIQGRPLFALVRISAPDFFLKKNSTKVSFINFTHVYNYISKCYFLGPFTSYLLDEITHVYNF